MSHIQTVGVLGCGQMGGGVAQVSAAAGFRTVVREISGDLLARGRTTIEGSLAKFVERGKVTAQDRDATLGRLTFTTSLADLAGADIVIETVTESLDTPSLTIAAMAAATNPADRFVGLHFFNPVPLMKLVEVVRTVTTSTATFDRAMTFAVALGKEPIAAKDTSGFIVNLLLVPYLLDFVGLDTTLKIAEIMFDEYREARCAPPPLLKRMVVAGMYGRKSGRGFYDYATKPPTVSELGL